ncbi:MAG: tripartite tricarboxylate transporter substrate binding protein [Betaproteobacteria bacterium]|nr:tripartite tricarboxylate transporter substrate binding protein [Betaproteobacteria bacterium]
MRPLSALCLMMGVACAQPAWAAFPEKPVRVTVAFAPGASTDIIARMLAEPIGTALGQPMVIENKPGAGGNIATQQVKAAAPDGHTLLFHSVAVSVNPSLFRNAGYDLMKDFEPIAMAGVTPNLLFVNPSVKATTLAELIALARTTPLAYASSGNGTTTHLGAELLFRSLAGVDITHVPHQPAAASVAVIGGAVPVGSTSMPPVVPHAKSGKVRPIAVMSLQRSPVLPDVPTVAESGYPGFEASTWFAVFAPAGTPQAVLQRLNGEFNRALQTPDIVEKFAKQSLTPQPLDRAALRAYISGEVAKWGKVVRDAGIKVD